MGNRWEELLGSKVACEHCTARNVMENVSARHVLWSEQRLCLGTLSEWRFQAEKRDEQGKKTEGRNEDPGLRLANK